MSAVFEFPSETYRLMVADDLPAIMEIEQRSYEFPWTEGIFHDCMRFGYSSWVIEIDRELVGYAIMSIAVQECHILNICVDPQQQGQGIGRRLLMELLSIAQSRGLMSVRVAPSKYLPQRTLLHIQRFFAWS